MGANTAHWQCQHCIQSDIAAPSVVSNGSRSGAAAGSSSSSSSSSSTLCGRQQEPHQQGLCQVHCQHSKRGVVAACLLALLLLFSITSVDAAATQCAVKTPVCPTRSEALARKPMFDMETPQRIDMGSSQPAGSSRRRRRSHKASTAAGPQPAAARASSPATVPRMSRDAAVSLLVGMSSRKERLFVPQGPQGGLAQDMPQRVMPTADLPLMSQAAQQELFSQLLGVLQGDAANSSIAVGVPAGDAAAQASMPSDGAVLPATPTVVPVQVQVTQPCGSGVQSDCGMLFLSNARLRVGVDTSRGGAITFISSPVMPPEWANVNLINTWDAGRLIQQSYYGCYDNTCWVDRPWRWNPVQGGSWQNGPPRLLARSMGAASVTTASVPRNWGGQELLDDVLMVTETELHPNVVKARFTMRYSGDAPHPAAHQEVPAVFLHRGLNVLAMYTGAAPWSNGDLTFIMPGQVGEYYRPTERWAAYVDMASGFGVGVYTPVADQLVAYRIGPENSAARSDVSYMAPLVTSKIQPNTEFSYDAYIAVGRVDEIRAWFSEIAARVQPTNEAGSYTRPIPAVLTPRPLQGGLGGRSPDAARQPRVSLLVEPKPPAVKLTPGGSDAVAFSKAVPTADDITINSKAASPPPAGIKVGPKPGKPPGKPAAKPKQTPAAPHHEPTKPNNSTTAGGSHPPGKEQQQQAAAKQTVQQPPAAWEAAATAVATAAAPQAMPPPNARLAGSDTAAAPATPQAAAAVPPAAVLPPSPQQAAAAVIPQQAQVTAAAAQPSTQADSPGMAAPQPAAAPNTQAAAALASTAPGPAAVAAAAMPPTPTGAPSPVADAAPAVPTAPQTAPAAPVVQQQPVEPEGVRRGLARVESVAVAAFNSNPAEDSTSAAPQPQDQDQQLASPASEEPETTEQQPAGAADASVAVAAAKPWQQQSPGASHPMNVEEPVQTVTETLQVPHVDGFVRVPVSQHQALELRDAAPTQDQQDSSPAVQGPETDASSAGNGSETLPAGDVEGTDSIPETETDAQADAHPQRKKKKKSTAVGNADTTAKELKPWLDSSSDESPQDDSLNHASSSAAKRRQGSKTKLAKAQQTRRAARAQHQHRPRAGTAKHSTRQPGRRQHDDAAVQAHKARPSRKQEQRSKAQVASQPSPADSGSASTSSKDKKKQPLWHDVQSILQTMISALQPPAEEQPLVPACDQRGSAAAMCV